MKELMIMSRNSEREKAMQDEMNDLQYTKPEDPDIVKVVRCHNCVAQRTCRYAQILGDNGYCSYGVCKERSMNE